MKHKLEWREWTSVESPGKYTKFFTAPSKLSNASHNKSTAFEYRLVKQKGRWVDDSEPELLDTKCRSWSVLSDAKRALQNRENRLLGA